MVISASAIPGATAWIFEEWAADSPKKAVMMPHTVPNRPINGQVEPVVARNVIPDSSLVSSTLASRFIERSTFSTPPKFGRETALRPR